MNAGKADKFNSALLGRFFAARLAPVGSSLALVWPRLYAVQPAQSMVEELSGLEAGLEEGILPIADIAQQIG